MLRDRILVRTLTHAKNHLCVVTILRLICCDDRNLLTFRTFRSRQFIDLVDDCILCSVNDELTAAKRAEGKKGAPSTMIISAFGA